MRLIENWQIDKMSKWIYNQWDRNTRFTPFNSIDLLCSLSTNANQIGGNHLYSRNGLEHFQPISTAYGAIISTYVSNQRYNLIKMFWKTLMSSHHSTCALHILDWKSFTMVQNKYSLIYSDGTCANFAYRYIHIFFSSQASFITPFNECASY